MTRGFGRRAAAQICVLGVGISALLPLGSGCREDGVRVLTASLRAEPAGLDFGLVPAHRLTTRELRLINESLDVAVRIAEGGTLLLGSLEAPRVLPNCDAGDFDRGFCLEGDAPDVIAADDAVSLAIGCRPGLIDDAAPPPLEDLLIIRSDAENAVLEVPLLCEGVRGALPSLVLCLPGDPPDYGLGEDCQQPPPEALFMDFGIAPIGHPKSISGVVRNAGEASLFVSDVRIEGDATGIFSIATDPRGDEIPVGGALPLAVVVRATDRSFVEATLVIQSDDPVQPELRVPLHARGNTPPVAVGGPDVQTAPLATAKLDGSQSYDPDGDAIVYYEWRIPQDYPDARPPGSHSQPEQSGTPDCLQQGNLPTTQCAPWQADLWMDIAGKWLLELVVMDEHGLFNVSREFVTIDVIPEQDLHIQMVWDNPHTDIDVHLLREGDTPFGAQDCYFANCSPNSPPTRTRPDWCSTGPGPGDPSLDIDDTDGFGPENINVDQPCADNYLVLVHYWSQRNQPLVISNVTLRVYCERTLRAELYQPMSSEGQLWWAARITWPGCDVEALDWPLEYRPPR